MGFGAFGPNLFLRSTLLCEAGSGKDGSPSGLPLDVNLNQEASVAPGLPCLLPFWR